MTAKGRERSWHRGLDRDAVIGEAIRILDTGGRDALTMRALATALEVEAASLYAHVESKDELVDAVLDTVLESVTVPEPDEDVRASLAAGFSSYRRTLLDHPAVVLLMTERARQSRTQLGLAERSIVLLERAGLSTRQAVDAHVTLVAYVLGFILQEVSRPARPPAGTWELTPVLRRALTSLGERPVDDRFALGLDLILDGVGLPRTSSAE